jgi:hypothetical protein
MIGALFENLSQDIKNNIKTKGMNFSIILHYPQKSGSFILLFNKNFPFSDIFVLKNSCGRGSSYPDILKGFKNF